ncbi:hypothetical protein LTR53_004495, partial [Teratosphaeriaceae sp. CCFEE 6253]
MRRAFQRCAASLPRSLALSTTLAPAAARRSSVPALARASRPAYRALHQTSLRRQGAAAAARAGEDADGSAPPPLLTRFAELGTHKVIHPTVVRTLVHDMGMETMTEVQQATINQALQGSDIIAQAKTGTGKTLAFLLPVLQNIIAKDPHLADGNHGRRGPRTTADDI